MRSWRNWQTRKTKDLVGNTMQVQFLSTAPTLNCLNFFAKKIVQAFLFCLECNIQDKKRGSLPCPMYVLPYHS